MSAFVFIKGGEEHVISGRQSMLKALGLNQGTNFVMTDETGELVAAGAGVEALNRSVNLVKSLKGSNTNLHKPKAVIFGKSNGLSGMEKIFGELNTLAKSMGISEVDDDEEDLRSLVIEQQSRIAELEKIVAGLSAKRR